MNKHQEAKYQIKNKKLIVSTNRTPKGKILTIKRHWKNTKELVYLADVFHETPSGFIYKDETGMGATYLELVAERNSIIVEPIKITASSKAYKHTSLYVGSSTRYHPEKTTSKEIIKNYIANDEILYKKIVVVADSLSKVIEAIGPNVYKDYFLLIDEIDSFQLDSTYRKSMEITLDYYKLFEPNNRAMLSATRIDFTDPILALEPITFIKYENLKPREISVITTNRQSLQGVAIDVISQISIENPNDKIFVAYNSVRGSLSLADHLVQKVQISVDKIKILCSSATSVHVGGYYHELDSDILPSQINFFTSAYFTGFDLKESYHLVSISGNSNEIQALSDRRIKQIAGRCRPGLLSETVIHDLYNFNEKEELSKESLIEVAIIQAAAMQCNKKHYSKSSVLKEILHEINSKMLAFLEAKNLRYVREDRDGNIVTSYLNIDAHLESIRVRNSLYRNKTELRDKLKAEGNSVRHKVIYSDTVVEMSDSKVNDRTTQVEAIIDSLKGCTNESMLYSLLRSGELSSFQRTITYEFLKVHSFVDSTKMLELMKKSLINSRDNRQFNSLMQAAVINILPKGNIAVDRLDFHFPIQDSKDTTSPKVRLTKKDIKQRMQTFLTELGNPAQNVTEANAIRLLNNLRKVYRKRDPNTKVDYYVITKSNPLNIPVVRKKPLRNGDDRFSLVY